MNIAAQLSGTDLNIFIEDSGWKKATLPFNRQLVKVELAVFYIDGNSVYHDVASKPDAPTTPPSLMFCRESLTVIKFKQELKKIGQSEPYEVLLSNNHFTLRKEYTNAYTLNFLGYENNPVFADWVVNAVPVLDAGLLSQRLREGKRYCTREFAEFREFTDLKAFKEHDLSYGTKPSLRILKRVSLTEAPIATDVRPRKEERIYRA
jgi:hypothetical protein